MRLACLTALLLALAAPAVAGASGWPLYGGDTARTGLSGDDGSPPLSALFGAPQGSQPRTSVVVTEGRGADGLRRVAVGTADGHLHLLELVTGGPALADVPVGDFVGQGSVGSLQGQGVTPVDTSVGDRLGNLLALHNGGGAVQITPVAEETGAKAADFTVPGSTGYTVSASPTVTAPDAAGNRVLFFVAFKPCATLLGMCSPLGAADDWELFRVPVSDPAGAAPQFGPVTQVSVPDANQLASPTLVTLEDAGGNPVPYVAVATNSAHTIQTFRVTDLGVGPTSDDLGDTGQSVSAAGGYLYVAVGQSTDTTTQVFKLGHADGGATLDTAGASSVVDGQPAVALALGATRVVVTTGKNVVMLDPNDLQSGVRLRFADDLTPGTSGFSQTTAAVMGGVAYVARDDGEPLALGLADAQPLAPAQFTPQQGQTSSGGWGQPAPADGAVVYQSAAGVYGYDATTPAVPVVSVAPVSVPESAGALHFAVALSGPTRRPVSVAFRTADGSATAGSDYTAVSGTLSFAPGQTSAAVDVPVANDPVDESDETLALILSSPVNARLAGDGTATGTIVDDDTARVVIDDATTTEGSSGLKPLGFRVHLTAPSARLVRVGYATADDTAHGGDDYDPVIGEVRFEPGQTEHVITVAIHGDRDAEGDERFHIDLKPLEGADIDRATAFGTIIDDDGPVRPHDRRARLRALLVELAPLIDRARPYRFTVRGRLVPPRGVKRTVACSGRVVLALSTGTRALVRARPAVHRSCRFAGALRLKALPRGVHVQALRGTVRFAGNRRVQPLQAPSLLARLR